MSESQSRLSGYAGIAIVAIITLIVVTSSRTFAQDSVASYSPPVWNFRNGPPRDTSNYWTFGPIFDFGGSRSFGLPGQLWQSNDKFTWSAGGMVGYSINDDMATLLNVSYDKRAIDFAELNNQNVYQNYRLEYVDINPMFRYKFLVGGFSVDIPVAGEVTQNDQTHAHVVSEYLPNRLLTIFELKLGGTMHVINVGDGEVRALINATYPLTSIFKVDPQLNEPGGAVRDVPQNGLVTIRAGLTYQKVIGR